MSRTIRGTLVPAVEIRNAASKVVRLLAVS